jgi:hypothetical protein
MVVNGLVAIGTLLTVIAALYGNILRAKFRPPLLRVSLVNSAGEKTVVTNRHTGEQVEAVRYYHLRVSNENRRWSTATNLGVHLIRLDEPGPDGQLQVTWTGDAPIQCRHQEIYPLRQDIGSPVDYNLCSVSKSVLSLHPISVPNNLKARRSGASHFVALFQVKSTQVDSDIVPVQIDWDGKWDDGDAEMQSHLKVKLLLGFK